MGVTPGDDWSDHRFLPRHDQGEHEVGFQFLFGRRFVEREISQAASILNAAPYYQVFYPDGRSRPRTTAKRRTSQDFARSIELDRAGVQITAVKRSETGNGLIVRLQEVDGRGGEVGIKVRGFRQRVAVPIGPFELKTVRLTRRGGRFAWRELNLVEGL